jgi:FKBP-type peptidyl-prolyl cis-trans isomerase
VRRARGAPGRRPVPVLVLTLLVALVVAGCGGGSSGGGNGGGGSVPAGFPKVDDTTFGGKPTVTSKGMKPGSTLRSTVLDEGDGPVVKKGELLVANYVGQVFGTDKVFDSSFTRDAPASFAIGAGQVIPGWDKTLVGVPAGSRVLMVVPPKEGYGDQGNPQAGIKGTDTLVFVVDVIGSYAKGAALTTATPVKNVDTQGIRVGGKLGQPPTVHIAKGTPEPTKPSVTVVAKGNGEPVPMRSLVVLEYVAYSWQGQPLDATWTRAPQGAAVGSLQQPSPFDRLVGIPVGSRVIFRLPKSPTGSPPQSVLFVIDIVAALTS